MMAILGLKITMVRVRLTLDTIHLHLIIVHRCSNTFKILGSFSLIVPVNNVERMTMTLVSVLIGKAMPAQPLTQALLQTQ